MAYSGLYYGYRVELVGTQGILAGYPVVNVVLFHELFCTFDESSEVVGEDSTQHLVTLVKVALVFSCQKRVILPVCSFHHCLKFSVIQKFQFPARAMAP